MTWKIGLGALAALCAVPVAGALADPGFPGELRLGGGVDISQKSGMAAASLQLGPIAALAWDNDNYGIGATWDFGSARGFSLGVGGFIVRRTDEDLGTRLNILFRGSFCGDKLCLSLVHLSHGAALGISTGKANSGLNFFLLEYRLLP